MLPDQLANSGWTAEKWDELEAHAREVVSRHTCFRHVIPRGPDMPGAYVVNVITKEANGLSLSVKGATQPTKIEVEFALLSEQIGDFDMALRIVERAARSLAVQEDKKIYFDDGLLSSAGTTVDPKESADRSVASGRNQLNGENIPYRGPYCLAAEPKFWEEMILPRDHKPRGLLPTVEALLGADARIFSVVKRGRDNEDDEGAGRAVLFSIDSFAMDLVFVEPPTLAVAGFDKDRLKLVLQERFKLRVIDGKAICKLTLK
ncbi:MAG: hypothetical protein HOV80_38870 [Polyangiaceae bacterium]|nr:hypothetical protein [Polyangiaceae bacterium]